jgi:aromatic-L-amino-acid decarboxylase
VDAAWAGTALILPDYQWMAAGLESADSFVFNPHKWMFTNFDCSAYFVKDHEILVKTFALVPEYLKTATIGVKNYSDWSIQLGRRFRALKLWFVIRNFGVEGLREKIANHVSWALDLAAKVERHPDFQLMAPAPLSTVCFRYSPKRSDSDLNDLNQKLLKLVNQSGKVYLTHTRLNGNFVIRLVVGQTYQLKEDIDKAWNVIENKAQDLKSQV